MSSDSIEGRDVVTVAKSASISRSVRAVCPMCPPGSALHRLCELVTGKMVNEKIPGIRNSRKPLNFFRNVTVPKIRQIGRGTGRESVCQYDEIWVAAGSLKTKQHNNSDSL